MAEMLLENPNWNKYMIDRLTGKLMVRKMRKLKAYLRPILTTFFFRAHAGKTEKNTSQQQFSVLSTSHSDT